MTVSSCYFMKHHDSVNQGDRAGVKQRVAGPPVASAGREGRWLESLIWRGFSAGWGFTKSQNLRLTFVSMVVAMNVPITIHKLA